jgi:hypothetical protein
MITRDTRPPYMTPAPVRAGLLDRIRSRLYRVMRFLLGA